jgi:hypothetical protein
LRLLASAYIEFGFLAIRQLPQLLVVKLRRKAKVQKTWTRDLPTRENTVWVFDILKDHFRDDPRGFFGPLRPQHRDVGCKIAKLPLLGRLKKQRGELC